MKIKRMKWVAASLVLADVLILFLCFAVSLEGLDEYGTVKIDVSAKMIVVLVDGRRWGSGPSDVRYYDRSPTDFTVGPVLVREKWGYEK